MKKFLKAWVIVCLIVTLIPLSAIHAENVYEAESALLSGAEVETEHSGFTGDGYVNFEPNEPGGYIEWNINVANAGDFTLEFRFANGSGDHRPAEIQVNGHAVESNLSFPSTGAWDNWDTASLTASLNGGSNTIRLTGTGSDGGGNIDHLNVIGNGGDDEPSVPNVPEGVSASAGDGQVTVSWDGVSEADSYTVKRAEVSGGPYTAVETGMTSTDYTDTNVENGMTYYYVVTAVNSAGESGPSVEVSATPQSSGAGDQPSGEVIGWADVPGDNEVSGTWVETTRGGAGGRVVTVTTGEQLYSEIDALRDAQAEGSDEALILKVQGTLTYSDQMLYVKEVKNVSIIGEGSDAKIKGFGLKIAASHNIIVQNIAFEDSPNDSITITDASHHVWIDHCSFSDIPIDSPPNREAATSDANNDGSIDVKRQASYVTISNSRFENHSKVLLIGHSESYAEDSGHLKVTLHHNWFGYVWQRTTRNRFGQVHLFNNYYKFTGSMLGTSPEDGLYRHGYAIAAVCDARVVVENNYFEEVIWPTLVSRPIDDPIWIETYGYTSNGEVHWQPTSEEPPGYITYRGENIQSPGPGTVISQEDGDYAIKPFDTTNPDPTGWNPWDSYGYDAAEIADILDDAAEVPQVVMQNAGAGNMSE